MPGTRSGKQPAPKQQQEVVLLKQRIAALENRLSGLLKELDTRKQFFTDKRA